MDFRTITDVLARYEGEPIIKDIHPDDTMWHGSGQAHYFPVGKHAISLILSGLSLSWINSVRRVLDLPSGHGRVGRHLRAAFPQAELYFCDIDRSGADFCAATFGGHAIYSDRDPAKVELPSDLDLIWIGSLFTHLPYGETLAWTERLMSCLRPHGVLVATVCGPYSFNSYQQQPGKTGGADWPKIERDFYAHGFGFDSYPSSPGYGVAMTRPGLLVDDLTKIPGTRLLAYTER
jgi:hypothetical protein